MPSVCATTSLRRTTIPARDLTTSELARQLKVKDVPADWSAQVIEVLRVCDSVKFAGDVLELTTIHGLIDMVGTAGGAISAGTPPATQPSKHTKLNGGDRMTFQFAAPWLLTLLMLLPLLAYVLHRKQARHQTAGLRFASVGLAAPASAPGARPCARC